MASTFSALNRRYLRISKNTTLEVRIYLHPDLIPTFTDELLDVIPPDIPHTNLPLMSHAEADIGCPADNHPKTQGREFQEKRQEAYKRLSP
jgi:hypothetical protein